MKSLAIDLYAGLGGWTEGLLAAGFYVIGFDIERHVYGAERYPAQLVLQDVRTLDGAQFKDAALIVASSPCQEFSYRAMPWKRAKALGPPLLGMELFAQAARIQREASAAAGRHIPCVQENVRGAQKYVGRAQWHYGSYYLWGDVPALMPMTLRAQKANPDGTAHGPGSWFAIADSKECGSKNAGGQNPVHEGQKTTGHINQRDGHGHTRYLTNQAEHDGVKQGGDWFNAAALYKDGQQAVARRSGSKSSARKAASARIAKIPFALASFIARTYYPDAARREG